MTQIEKTLFWTWFEQYHKELFDLPNKSDVEFQHWQNELSEHLETLHQDFKGIITHEKQEAILTVTVDGISDLFNEVDDLVAEAPVITGWKFSALLPPGCYDKLIEKLKIEVGIDPKEFRFTFCMPKPNKRAEIVVFHPLYTPEIDIMMFDLADRTILNLLGERSYGNNIEVIDLKNLSDAEHDKLESMSVLPTIFNSGFVVDREGVLVGLAWNKK